MFVSIRSKTKHDSLWLPPTVLVDDGYYLVELDEINAGILERVEGDGPGVMVSLEGELHCHRGALSYRDGKKYLRWDPKSIRDYNW